MIRRRLLAVVLVLLLAGNTYSGLTKVMTFYHQFKASRALVDAKLEQALQRFIDATGALQQAGFPTEQCRGVRAHLLEFLEDLERLFVVAFGGQRFAQPAEVLRVFR